MSTLYQKPYAQYINYVKDCSLPEGHATIATKFQLQVPNGGAIVPVPYPGTDIIRGDYFLLDTSALQAVKRFSAVKSLNLSAQFNSVNQASIPQLMIFVEGSTQTNIFAPVITAANEGTFFVSNLNCSIPIFTNVPARIWFIAFQPIETATDGSVVINASINNYESDSFVAWDVPR